MGDDYTKIFLSICPFELILRVIADDRVQFKGDRGDFKFGKVETEMPGFTPNMKLVYRSF